MKQLLIDIVNSIVDHPEKVVIEESTDEEGNINFTLTVDPEDMGKIIGKEGKVIKSIRNIIRIPAIKQNKKVNLELTEQDRIAKEGEESETQAPAENKESKDSDKQEGVDEEPSSEEISTKEAPSEVISNEEAPSEEAPQEEVKEKKEKTEDKQEDDKE